MSRVVEIDYTPRPQQEIIHAGLDSRRFSVVVAHRRMGKTVMAVNHLIRAAVCCTQSAPRYAYVAPSFAQAKDIAWNYLWHFAGVIPGVTANQSELRVDFAHNGARIRLYGAENPERFRGLYFDGVVLDEYGLMPPHLFSEVLRPTLSDRQGWALFMGTPSGKNQFYDVAQVARKKHAENDPMWFFAEFKASATGAVAESELELARQQMTEDEYQQEYECSFEAAVKGAIYAKELSAARDSGRITRVPVEPTLPVDTDWDLGVGDATSIWFTQSLRGGELRVVDYYEASGEGLPHYAQVLKSKGYHYGTHWAPHDILVRELASGRSRLEAAQSLGIRFEVCPDVGLEDGIHAARMLLPSCYFDATRCEAGLESLQHYRRDYNTRLNEFKAVPVHDWASHGADAFRYLAVRQRAPKLKREQAFNVALPRDVQTAWMS